MNCLICDEKMKKSVYDFTYFCAHCSYWKSNLNVKINTSNLLVDEAIDAVIDHSHLRVARFANYQKIIKRIESISGKTNIKMLDVGCGPGFYLRVAGERNHQAIGIEPNPALAEAAKLEGNQLIQGYFPDDISEKERFDVIVFNDVLEHIPDLSNIVEGVRKHLEDDGILVINVPSSDGPLFKISKLLYKIGLKQPWDRLWQTMFYTPHIHYFSKRSLQLFSEANDFVQIGPAMGLSDINLRGLYHRVSLSPGSWFLRLFLFFSAVGFWSVQKFLPHENNVLFLEKKCRNTITKARAL